MWGKITLELKAMVRGILTAGACWLFAGVLVFLRVLFSQVPVYYLEPLLYVFGLAGVLAGSFVAGQKGRLHGLGVGFLLGLLGLLLNLKLVPELYAWWIGARQLLVWSLWGLVGGSLGEIWGRRPRRENSAGKREKEVA